MHSFVDEGPSKFSVSYISGFDQATFKASKDTFILVAHKIPFVKHVPA